MKVHIIRTDGSEEQVEVNRRDPFGQLRPILDIETFDTVNLRDGRVMLVDDAGYETELVKHPAEPGEQVAGRPLDFKFEMRTTRARKPVNKKATALYHGVCRPGTTHQIVGDVAIVWDKDMA